MQLDTEDLSEPPTLRSKFEQVDLRAAVTGFDIDLNQLDLPEDFIWPSSRQVSSMMTVKRYDRQTSALAQSGVLTEIRVQMSSDLVKYVVH